MLAIVWVFLILFIFYQFISKIKKSFTIKLNTYVYEKAHINKCMKESAYSAIWAASVKNYKKILKNYNIFIYFGW